MMKKEGMDFSHKVVAVTGAASGIGREIARAFAARGADLALADINEESLLALKEELESQGCKVYAQVVDVSVAEQVQDFCDMLYQEMGRVDVLCNNAGIAIGGEIKDMTLDDWESLVGVILWGVIYGCHYFYPRMIEQGGGGHIVNTASIGGLTPFPRMAAYCCAKFGVVGLSETLRAEAALHGIGVSVICPGFVATNMVKASKITSGSKRSTPEQHLRAADRVLMLRNYPPSRVGEAVVKAVERNKGVVPVTPEAYLIDFSYRFSRRIYGALIGSAAKVMSKL
jgi:NAD(P)-dependent dehydrogenase (short-subunit alcohol dehydrogenase family)